jgi:tRNA A-37 threonylcarbamoyl transferase component Bud32
VTDALEPTVQSGERPPIACAACGTKNGPDLNFCPTCGHALRAKPMEIVEPHELTADPLIGRTIASRYRIISLVGRGGMGVVYKVEHVHIGKLMAMKLLHGELARDRDTVKRFRREAEAASRLNHPNTVQIFDFDRHEGLMYLVMEFVEGRDLGWIIQYDSPLSLVRVAKICAQVCASVGQAHAAGIIHRDIKPENVMVTVGRETTDFVKVLDFGLAKLRQEDANLSVTRAGSIIGTPYYMAPEHIRGDVVDPRADIYSLGAVMYKALSGLPPFWATSPMGVLTKHLTDDPIPPSERASRRDLPPEGDAIVLKAMEKDPNARYQSMEELRADLLEFLGSVGESIDDGTGKVPSGASVLTSSGKRRMVQVATRTDVDYYERRIRRRGWLGAVVALGAVLTLGVLAYFVYANRNAVGLSDAESEANNDAQHADPLPRGRAYRGHLGRRQTTELGDADVYRIENPGGRRTAIALEVTSLPNMDIAVDLVRAGVEEPALIANTGAVGEPESIPNFPLVGSVYFARVREVAIVGHMPTENVSDAYAISWDFVDTSDGEEREVNDSLEVAESVEVGEELRGYIGWAGDLDTYCLASDAARIQAHVTALPAVDLVLRSIDRAATTSRKIDLNRVGQPEESRVIENARAHETCFEVSAGPEGERASSTHQYVFRVEAVEG